MTMYLHEMVYAISMHLHNLYGHHRHLVPNPSMARAVA